jgi:hypothetical protein
MSDPKTAKDVFDERGPCALMMKVLTLAELKNRVPVGEWDYQFASNPAWRLCVNGGLFETWTPSKDVPPIKRFEAYVAYQGWPAAIFNTVEGIVTGVTETMILDAFDTEIDAKPLRAHDYPQYQRDDERRS